MGGAPSFPSSSWRCDHSWDGIDFTPCFRDHLLITSLALYYLAHSGQYSPRSLSYLSNFSLLLILLSVPFVLQSLYHHFTAPLQPARLTPETLTSSIGDQDLSRLESDVILSALAANLLPPAGRKKDGLGEPVSSKEAGKVVQGYGEGGGRKGLERVWKVVEIGGALAFLGVEIGRTVVYGDWRGIAFPAFLLLLTAIPSSRILVLLTFHLVPQLLVLRSLVIRHQVKPLLLAPIFVELAYWLALISIPYGHPMDRLLGGTASKGGGSSGSEGADLPSHIEEPTSAFSRATYTFILPMLFRHYYNPIKMNQIPAMREDDSTSASLGAFRADQAKRDAAYALKHKGQQRKRDLGWELLRFFLPEILTQSVWAVIFIVLQYLPPTGLRLLLKYVSERETARTATPTHVAFLYVAIMAVGQCAGVTAMGQSLYIGRRVCIRLRSIIITEVFTKALRRRDISGNVKKEQKVGQSKAVGDQAEGASEGKIANLVSSDAFRIGEICAYIFYLASCPTAVIINSVLLYNALGLAAFAGIGVLVLLIPIQAGMGRLYTIVQRKLMAATDARLEAVTEVISHVKLIKFNAWESKFFDRMSASRKHELYCLAQRFATDVLGNTIVWGTPVLVTAAAFSVHSLVLKQPLTPDVAFSSLILFNMLRDPLALFEDTFTRLLQAYTSCVRIQAYLEEPETLKYSQLTRPGPADPQIGFRGAVIGYHSAEDTKDAEYEPFRLGDLDLSFPNGGLSVITGPVGCGKTTLIMSLLGETILLQGKVYMPDDHANRDFCPVDPSTGLSDTIAFCAQTPWLVGASIRENIVFGSSWDQARYNEVVDACALRRDFEIFDLGDETEVGEKGTTCSGGQKARIALARALFSPAKTIILDDVLSAVDAQTARHLHVHCLHGPLMKGRTVILVSHAVNLVVPSASYVVMLDAGKVIASGTPSELTASGALDLTDEELESATASSSTLTPDTPADIIEEHLDGMEGDALETQKQLDKDNADPAAKKLEKQLVAAEEQGSGSIGFSIYLIFFRAMGGIPFWVVLLTFTIGAQVVQVGNNAWIRDWANSNNRASSVRAWVAEPRSSQWYLGIYLLISLAYLVAVTMRMTAGYLGSLTASRALYDRLLKRILGAKMRFFDSTPSGRIMNRLSKDMSAIDTEAAEILMYFTWCCLSVVAVLAVVVFSTPSFMIALVVISVLYWLVGSLYVTTSTEIKRYDSVSRSPVFVSFSEALVGMSTIRSYGDSARFMRKLFQEVDANSRCFWYLWQTNRVLNNFSNFVGSLVTIFASFFALNSPSMNAGEVGFSITYALSFTEFVLWVVRLYAASQMSMNSVERVAEYLDLEVEEEEHAKGVEPPAYWPSKQGSVVVENLTCRYAPQLDPVLRGISFTIEPKEKIGICGRTGSGKSTLALSFFRFLHQDGGSITIDGLDISKLSLTTLRSRLTILPQEAQLFSGSIRDNLDPFGQHEDYELWEALRQCGLSGKTPGPSRMPSRAVSRAASSRNLPAEVATADKQLRAQTLQNLQVDAFKSGLKANEEEEEDEGREERVVIRSLDERVAVGGKNYSQGQRQLLALARGLLKLRSSSFLIMDESTANLDHATDMTIQNVLRTGLADTQMLVIAHRLMTVCGLDRILVLDHGKVVEYGTPWELMQTEDGSFRDLCRQSGEEKDLFEMAKKGHEAKVAFADER